jgi:hypothetical protein
MAAFPSNSSLAIVDSYACALETVRCRVSR